MAIIGVESVVLAHPSLEVSVDRCSEWLFRVDLGREDFDFGAEHVELVEGVLAHGVGDGGEGVVEAGEEDDSLGEGGVEINFSRENGAKGGSESGLTSSVVMVAPSLASAHGKRTSSE